MDHTRVGGPAVDPAASRDLRSVHVVEFRGVAVDDRAAPGAGRGRVAVQEVEARAVGRREEVEAVAVRAGPARCTHAPAAASPGVAHAVEGAVLVVAAGPPPLPLRLLPIHARARG